MTRATAARKPDPTPEDGAIYYAWRLGYGSVEQAIDFSGWSTENTDWGKGTPREQERWHERTTRRFLLAYIKEHDDEVDRLRRVEQAAREVMAALQEHGASVVAHLLDDDNNSGERLRQALAQRIG